MKTKNRLRELREEHGLTQYDLAEKLNMPQPQYWRYEQGKRNVPTDVILRLAECYRVSTDYLLGVSDDRNIGADSSTESNVIVLLSGERIRKCRHSMKMTQEEVAKHLGVTKQTIYKYESGIVTNVPMKNISKLAELFHVSQEYLAGFTGEMCSGDVRMDEKESQLVNAYRSVAKRDKAILLQIAQMMIPKENKSLED